MTPTTFRPISFLMTAVIRPSINGSTPPFEFHHLSIFKNPSLQQVQPALASFFDLPSQDRRRLKSEHASLQPRVTRRPFLSPVRVMTSKMLWRCVRWPGDLRARYLNQRRLAIILRLGGVVRFGRVNLIFRTSGSPSTASDRSRFASQAFSLDSMSAI